MIKNPFTPVFGGKPQLFFGRKDILARFSSALRDEGSEYRALFVTGTRGSGKTALLEQLSSRARKAGWLVIDLGPEDTVRALVRRLSGYDELTKTVDPQVSVSVLGSGGSLGGVSTSRTTRVDKSDLDLLLIEAIEHASKGVMVTVDEIQKLTESDVSAISNAFQMASRKGLDAILVVAGLPYAYDEVIRYNGCTFMRRAVHQRIGLLSREEVTTAFRRVLDRAGIELDDDAWITLVRSSYGHPYLVQLLGYYLVAWVNESAPDVSCHVTSEALDDIVNQAIDAYRSRALRPMMAELSPSEQAYLFAAAQSLDTRRIAHASDIAQKLGKDVRQLSPVRARLLRNGLLVASGRGQLMFTVPYLADYVLSNPREGDEIQRLRDWGV